MNDDIIKDRAALNVHFKEPTGSYEQMFDSMVADGAISTRGLGKDPFIVDELVFDINTAYFEHHGGYDYAVSFFEEAYRCAVEEIGGEQYVLSAVMHADERNKELSRQLGYDVYHYHLHVMYVPVVDKEIYFKKNNKDPEKAGKLREVIKQVSHSKKWPKLKQYDENGEVIRNEKGKVELLNSYSLLQDHFHEHMKEAGFLGFERGARKSTRKHLEVLEFKAQQEAERAKAEAERAAAMTAVAEEKQREAAAYDTAIEGKAQTAARMDAQAEKKQQRLDKLDEAITVKDKAAATVAEVEAMGKPALIGSSLTVTADEMKTLKSLAKEGVKSRGIIAELKKQINGFVAKIKELTQKLTRYEGMGLTDTMKYYEALQRAPRRLAETVADIRRQPPERQESERTTPQRKRSTGMEH
jgi:chemotaxis protein histidine kinase CheA